MGGFVVWFTGLSGSGKSTLAAMLGAELARRGVHVEALDGDEVRTHLSKGLSFSREDRATNIRRIGFVAKLVARAGACAITAAISPYRELRDEQRRQIARFCEVYCECPIERLAARDPKGLYAKALAGEIRHFTGVDDPYEPPERPEVVCRTDRETKEQSLARILAKLEELGWIPTDAHAIAGAGHARSRDGAVLPRPHGGELVDRVVRGAERERLLERARSMPRVRLDERGTSDVGLVANGAFSPLRGFLGEKDYLRVVREARLENGLVWPMPVTLAVGEEQARTTPIGAEVLLEAPDGRPIAVLEVSDAYRPDKEREAREVFRTIDRAHPGVAALAASGPVYLGGELRVLDRGRAADLEAYDRDPAELRALFASRGFRTVVGFQSRNAPHRGHEYVTKCALEIVDALLIHPLVGATKGGDLPAALRMRCYEALVGRYYAKERTILAAYPAAMRFGGPREALLHALARKNYGCSHFVVGRDHAAAAGFYDERDAHAIFDAFSQAELGIAPLRFDDAFHSDAVGGMGTAKTTPEGTSARSRISGTELREKLRRGELPPPELVRPEVAQILVEALKRS